ncbi:peptidoglycan editing factor PgeF [Agrobacterium rubi]|uniref:Purine nucleoside phosphorylase n=1 Tax=Agrobacterium rubi TaxID=28099 RepID=A0AAE7QZZ9_9HYPH|nr:peptidoglycan editing factor PgeF [Agrobacterium rubi]NTE86940.1 peptidoglycan editing factor PgeF [Agrobacterium rubi]NTF02874.1 peptidoglycan editing factor PgeF [Agrobacterium rubi]NTF37118.1 peptidoglycan editing factor PgeF [Agrobacterium rubi]OCJ55296.1 polyphenol oxidase [Agrobacterium rubi]QTF99549.1 peptidoglycan editing factor PgeF [Agrobacterium rubi]
MQDETLPLPLQSPLLAASSGKPIRHGFFTRHGGVSEGIYRGLNVGLGSHDVRQSVMENRKRVASWFGMPVEKLATVHQMHSPDVIVIDEQYNGERPEADAMVTATPGIVIGVLSADCGPILFADAQAQVVGAAHAGWKGAVSGVLENTIEAMIALGATRERIVASLGPSISRENYEVGPERVENLKEMNPAHAAYFSPSPNAGHAFFDLKQLTIDRLIAAGVTAENLDLCTYPDEDSFYSYRRTTHRGEPDYGRQISAIAILEN